MLGGGYFKILTSNQHPPSSYQQKRMGLAADDLRVPWASGVPPHTKVVQREVR